MLKYSYAEAQEKLNPIFMNADIRVDRVFERVDEAINKFLSCPTSLPPSGRCRISASMQADDLIVVSLDINRTFEDAGIIFYHVYKTKLDKYIEKLKQAQYPFTLKHDSINRITDIRLEFKRLT